MPAYSQSTIQIVSVPRMKFPASRSLWQGTGSCSEPDSLSWIASALASDSS